MNRVSTESAARLLVIDPDEAMQLVIEAIFHRLDVMVDCTGDALSALALLRRTDYDVVIVDGRVSGPDGVAMIGEMKRFDESLPGRTIVLTVAARITFGDFIDGEVVRRVMAKPLDVGELVDEVLSLTSAVLDQAAPLSWAQYVH